METIPIRRYVPPKCRAIVFLALFPALSGGCAPFRVAPPVALGALFFQARGTDLSLTPGPNAITVYEDTQGPRDYRASTLEDSLAVEPLSRRLEKVDGEACRDRLVFPLAAITGGSVADVTASPVNFAGVLGKAGFADALEKAHQLGKRIAQGREGALVDVRSDTRTLSVLGGLFARQCLVINAYYAYSSSDPTGAIPLSPP